MPHSPSHNINKISERYVLHGDNRPPNAKLNDYATKLSHPPLGLELVTADIYIDLAMSDKTISDTALDSAEKILDDVIMFADDMNERGYTRTVERQSETLVKAVLKKAELSNWRQAAIGDAVRLDYEKMLLATDRAADYARGDTFGFLGEYIPLLFLARAIKFRNITNAVGRLALSREDTGRRTLTGQNKNWDCGISFETDTAEAYDRPDHRLQIKLGHNGRTGSYEAAGITLLRARGIGFSNVMQVIDSCLRESGEDVPSEEPLLTSTQMDDITKNIIIAAKGKTTS